MSEQSIPPESIPPADPAVNPETPLAVSQEEPEPAPPPLRRPIRAVFLLHPNADD